MSLARLVPYVKCHFLSSQDCCTTIAFGTEMRPHRCELCYKCFRLPGLVLKAHSHFAYCANDQSGLLDENEEDPLQGCYLDDEYEDVTPSPSAPSCLAAHLLEDPSGSTATPLLPKRRGRPPTVKVEATADASALRIASCHGAVQGGSAGPKKKLGRPRSNAVDKARARAEVKARARARARARAEEAKARAEVRRDFKNRVNNTIQPLVLEEGFTTRRFRCRKCKDLVVGDGALLRHWGEAHLPAGAAPDPSVVAAHELDDDRVRGLLDLPRKSLADTCRVRGGFSCPICAKVITSVSRTISHLYCHMESPPLNYVCTMCPDGVAFYEYSGHEPLGRDRRGPGGG
ncbi:uncharacterized protein LOC127749251 isoform X2 [Frankliniella occidentalis]|uniref:Uncharacterized protein LOC127749251 isoform X2 n=1 Tax=Frankliniella occidentalis TaxID=133901 RepID=A0A9C6WX89_FRAOC|nr:uncharacterized protein LOC127749251 isoform X2 [Frankliniella occidentalis]